MPMPVITASAFDEAVVGALTAWQPVEHGVLRGRQSIQHVLSLRTADEATWEIADRPDWAVPTLFLRLPEQRLEFVEVPSGSYRLGLGRSDLDRVSSQFTNGIPTFVRDWIRSPTASYVAAFRLSRWPVTNHQYRYFLEHAPSDLPLPLGFKRQGTSIALDIRLNPSAPVVHITVGEAIAFCRWMRGRLPTADEWEVAIRGPEGKIFPWGDTFQAECCSAVDQQVDGPQSVFRSESGISPLGIEDACGNVFEWTATEDGNNNVVVGGSWNTPPSLTIPSLRCCRKSNERYPDVGFRCVI